MRFSKRSIFCSKGLEAAQAAHIQYLHGQAQVMVNLLGGFLYVTKGGVFAHALLLVLGIAHV